MEDLSVATELFFFPECTTKIVQWIVAVEFLINLKPKLEIKLCFYRKGLNFPCPMYMYQKYRSPLYFFKEKHIRCGLLSSLLVYTIKCIVDDEEKTKNFKMGNWWGR